MDERAATERRPRPPVSLSRTPWAASKNPPPRARSSPCLRVACAAPGRPDLCPLLLCLQADEPSLPTRFGPVSLWLSQRCSHIVHGAFSPANLVLFISLSVPREFRRWAESCCYCYHCLPTFQVCFPGEANHMRTWARCPAAEGCSDRLGRARRSTWC